MALKGNQKHNFGGSLKTNTHENGTNTVDGKVGEHDTP